MPTKLIIGHRGFSSHYPENTMIALQEAVNAGALGIEFDVRKSRDGVYLLMHDATVDRTTDGTGNVASMLWSDIQDLDAGAWFDPQFAGTKVPSLEAVLDEFQTYDIWLFINIKLGLNDSLAILRDVQRRGILSKAVFFAPTEIINQLRRYDPRVIAVNDGTPGVDAYKAVLDNAVANDHQAVSVSMTALANNPHISEEIHNRGKRVLASFISSNYSTRMAQMIGQGVEYILGNDVEAMLTHATNAGVVQVPPSPMAGWRDAYVWA